jgi:hypothetical protein
MIIKLGSLRNKQNSSVCEQPWRVCPVEHGEVIKESDNV